MGNSSGMPPMGNSSGLPPMEVQDDLATVIEGLRQSGLRIDQMSEELANRLMRNSESTVRKEVVEYISIKADSCIQYVKANIDGGFDVKTILKQLSTGESGYKPACEWVVHTQRTAQKLVGSATVSENPPSPSLSHYDELLTTLERRFGAIGVSISVEGGLTLVGQ